MKSLHSRLLLSAVLIIAAILLVFVRTERGVILLPPISGAENRVQLVPETTYAQDFLINQTSIARLGFYFTTQGSLASEPLTLIISRQGTEVARANLETVFIDNQGPSFWQFNPPLKTIKGERITAKVTIPQSLGNQLNVKVRIPDGTFKAEDATFLINDKLQPSPLAYEVYASYKPPLSVQIAILCVLAAIALLFKPKSHIVITGGTVLATLLATIVYLSPTLIWSGYFPWFLLVTQTAAFLGVYWYLTHRGFHAAAAMVGAAIFAYTSWWPLQFAASRYVYAIVATLPLLYVVFSPSQSLIRRKAAGLVVLAVAIAIFWQGLQFPGLTPTTAVANMRDIFLDPYQVPYAQKVISQGQGIPWHNFGAYIGIPAALLTLIGIITSARKHSTPLIIGIALITALSLAPLLPSTLTILVAHTSIILVMVFAYEAALGLENLRHYLGFKSKVAIFLTSAVALIIVLDLWHVAADLLENLRTI